MFHNRDFTTGPKKYFQRSRQTATTMDAAAQHKSHHVASSGAKAQKKAPKSKQKGNNVKVRGLERLETVC